MLTRNDSEGGVDAMEHVVTETWLEMILTECCSRETGSPKVSVGSFDVSNGSEFSESVLSDIIALSVEAEVDEERKSFDFMVKLLPVDPFSRYFVTEAEFDLREIKFYTQVVPEFEEFQKNKQNNKPEIRIPVPKCYFAKYVPLDFLENPSPSPATDKINESIIILEDLKKKGYQNVSFKKGLTLEQVESAFKAISGLHALSLAIKAHDQQPLNEKYEFLFRTDKASLSYQQLMERGLPQLVNFLEKRDDMKEIVDCLKVIRPKTKYLTQALLTPREPIALITHTDFWSNNLLFKDDQCTVLDWQMVTYSRPTNDLALLIISSLPPCLRRQHTSHLLDLYWDNLVQNSKNLDLDVERELKYGREDLEVDYKSSQLLALLLCIGSIDVAFREPEIEERLLAVLSDLHANGVLSPDYINQV